MDAFAVSFTSLQSPASRQTGALSAEALPGCLATARLASTRSAVILMTHHAFHVPLLIPAPRSVGLALRAVTADAVLDIF
jgi:hypothetical protein